MRPALFAESVLLACAAIAIAWLARQATTAQEQELTLAVTATVDANMEGAVTLLEPVAATKQSRRVPHDEETFKWALATTDLQGLQDELDKLRKRLRELTGGELARRFRDDMEYTGEISHYLVDVVGDEEFLQSQFFYSQDEPLIANLGRLVNWYDVRRDDTGELAAIIHNAREVLKFAL